MYCRVAWWYAHWSLLKLMPCARVVFVWKCSAVAESVEPAAEARVLL